MRIEDSRRLIAVLMATYPNYNPIDVELAAETWAGVMEEYTYEQVDMALRSYMKTNTSGFPPVPGQIIDKMHTMTQPQELNEMEAWSLVSKAVRRSGYDSVEEFAKLPPLVQKAVGLPDQLRAWALDAGYREDVARSHFINCYKTVLERNKEIKKMPDSVLGLIENANEKSAAGMIEKKRKELSLIGFEREQMKNRAIEVQKIVSRAPSAYYDLMENLSDVQNDGMRGGDE